MAISGAGGWIPSVRVSLHNRTMILSPPIHNVPPNQVFMPEQAAAYFFDNPKAFIYVPVGENGGTIYLAELLEEMGLTGIPDEDQWRGG